MFMATANPPTDWDTGGMWWAMAAGFLFLFLYELVRRVATTRVMFPAAFTVRLIFEPWVGGGAGPLDAKGMYPEFGRVRFAVKHRLWLARRQWWRCAACWHLLPPQFEVDHSRPVGKGGSNRAKNLRVLCSTCHAHKTVFWDTNAAKQVTLLKQGRTRTRTRESRLA